jgi:hypothetical protein
MVLTEEDVFRNGWADVAGLVYARLEQLGEKAIGFQFESALIGGTRMAEHAIATFVRRPSHTGRGHDQLDILVSHSPSTSSHKVRHALTFFGGRQ